jgi:N-acetylglucosaminyl-diphospho-decaprenol L-rhamnosyltransferase
VSSEGPVDVSVVVVNHRSAALTVRALGDAAASAGTLALQEIVVDNGSGADEVARLRAGRPGAEVVAAENRGFAAGNNAGVARATGRHLLLLNPDAFCQDDALARLAAHLDAHPEVGVAAPRLVFAGGARQDNAYRRFPDHWTLVIDYCAPLAQVLARTPWDPHRAPWASYAAGRPALRVAHVTGAALLVRAEAATAAGPLDEAYFLYYEETEWQRRIAAAGWAVDVLPDAVVTHLGGGSTGTFPLASPHYLDSVARYFGDSRRSRAIVAVGSVVSWLTLSAAVRLGLGNEAVAFQARGYREVLGALRRRRGRRR